MVKVKLPKKPPKIPKIPKIPKKPKAKPKKKVKPKPKKLDTWKVLNDPKNAKRVEQLMRKIGLK